MKNSRFCSPKRFHTQNTPCCWHRAEPAFCLPAARPPARLPRGPRTPCTPCSQEGEGLEMELTVGHSHVWKP